MDVTLRIHDPSGSVRRDVRLELQETGTVNELVDSIVELFGWPRETMDGEPVSYGVRRLGEQGMLDERTQVASLGLVHGDAVVLGPVARVVTSR